MMVKRTKPPKNGRTARVGGISGRTHARDWNLPARMTPFIISEIPENKLLKKEYGHYHLKIRGGLWEQDGLTWVAIKDLSPEPGKFFPFTIVEIAKEMGLTNPWDPKAQDAIRASLERLLEFEIRIYNRQNKIRAKYSFLTEGELYTDADGKVIGGRVSISSFLDAMEKMESGYFFLDKSTYFSLGSPLARNLYKFLQSQRFLTRRDSGDSYFIHMDKLLGYIDLPPEEGRKPWQIWHHALKPACEELKKVGVISDYAMQVKRKGGERLITFYRPELKEAPAAAKEGEATDYEHIERIIKEQLDPGMVANYKQKTLAKHLKPLEEKLNNHQGVSLTTFVQEYLGWLQDEKRLQYFSPGLFKLDNQMLHHFVESDMAWSNLNLGMEGVERLRRDFRAEGQEEEHTKKREDIIQLTQADLNRDREKEREEREEEDRFRPELGMVLSGEQRELIGNKECPFGKVYAKDFINGPADPGEEENICEQCKRTHDLVWGACYEDHDRDWDW